MLVLSRRRDEKIVFTLITGQQIELVVAGIDGQRVRLGVTAPDEVQIMRAELCNQDSTCTNAVVSCDERGILCLAGRLGRIAKRKGYSDQAIAALTTGVEQVVCNLRGDIESECADLHAWLTVSCDEIHIRIERGLPAVPNGHPICASPTELTSDIVSSMSEGSLKLLHYHQVRCTASVSWRHQVQSDHQMQ
jgi:carbon storage regulator CsrA